MDPNGGVVLYLGCRRQENVENKYHMVKPFDYPYCVASVIEPPLKSIPHMNVIEKTPNIVVVLSNLYEDASIDLQSQGNKSQ